MIGKSTGSVIGGAILGACVACASPPPGPAALRTSPGAGEVVGALAADGLWATLHPRRAGAIVIDAADGLSPEEAALMAVDKNPRLRAIRASRGIAQAEVLSAGLLPNPRLATAVNVPAGGADADVVGYGVGISWNVTSLLSRGTRRGSAAAQAKAVDLEVTWQEWQVAQAARQHVVRVIYLTRRAQWAGEAEETWGRRYAGLREAVASGAATALQAMSMQRAFHRARLDRLALEQQLAAERVSLNEAIGLAPEAKIQTDLDWRAQVNDGTPVRNALSGLEDRRPDLVALRHSYRSRNLALRMAITERFPPIEIGLQYSREVDDVRAAGIGITLTLPFFDRAQGDIARGYAERSRIQAEYDARLAQARADVVRIASQITVARLRLQAASEAAQVATQLAQRVREVSQNGALDVLAAADAEDRAYAAGFRELEIEQEVAELEIAYDTTSATWGSRR